MGATRAKRQLELLCYESKFGEPMTAGRTFIDQLLGEEVTQINPQPKPKKVRAKPPTYEDGPTQAQIAAWEKDYIAGTEVIHKQFGQGAIVGRMGSIAVIVFNDHGVKRIELPTCLKKGLIRLAGL